MSSLVKVEGLSAEMVLIERADTLEVYTSAEERRLIKSGGTCAIMELPDHSWESMETSNGEGRRGRLRATLGFIFRDLGLKVSPTVYDVERMLDYIETNHPKFTTADVKSAFEMFLAGKFEDSLPDRHDHYQQFSVSFYARIFRCYSAAQKEARHTVRHKIRQKQLLLSAPTEATELMKFRSLSIIREQVRSYLENGHMRVLAIGYTHDWLVRLKVCGPVLDPTKEERTEALNRLRDKKGKAVPYAMNLDRILHGERVNDVEWEAIMHKRTRAMYTDLGNKGQEAMAVIDAELDRLREAAKAKGVDVDSATAAA